VNVVTGSVTFFDELRHFGYIRVDRGGYYMCFTGNLVALEDRPLKRFDRVEFTVDTRPRAQRPSSSADFVANYPIKKLPAGSPAQPAGSPAQAAVAPTAAQPAVAPTAAQQVALPWQQAPAGSPAEPAAARQSIATTASMEPVVIRSDSETEIEDEHAMLATKARRTGDGEWKTALPQRRAARVASPAAAALRAFDEVAPGLQHARRTGFYDFPALLEEQARRRQERLQHELQGYSVGTEF